MGRRLTSTGQPRAKATRQNRAALKAHDTRLKANPNAQRDAANKAVATKRRNEAARVKANAERMAIRMLKAEKAKATRNKAAGA